MTNKKIIYFSISLLVLSFIGCEPPEDDDIGSETLNLLTAGFWDVDKVQFRLPSETEWTDFQEDCSFDDVWEFSINEDWRVFPGEEICTTDQENTSEALSYRLTNNDTQIIFTIQIGDSEIDLSPENIETLTDNTFITTYEIGDVNNTLGRRIFSKL